MNEVQLKLLLAALPPSELEKLLAELDQILAEQAAEEAAMTVPVPA